MKKILFPVTFILLPIVVIILVSVQKYPERLDVVPSDEIATTGVCPPYVLLTAEGDTINPVLGLNTDVPYSPRRTCGPCHDIEKITKGYHFQQGKDELPDPVMSARAQWVSSPGNYGGPWCSPHPLYNYLSPKSNEVEQTIDFTSYTFIRSCGVCHPGGGSLEFDRDGLRYDRVVEDPDNAFVDGGLNDLDGDYYKAKWSASGVIEPDCYLCHMPDYDFKERTKQIQTFNYRWAGTAGARLATIEGSVAADTPVRMTWNLSMFDASGRVSPNVVRSPRNETCLNCHAKPGWKKRGANFRARTDVHLRAGLKCVDCHPAGNSAVHELIRGKEEHQFGKGDDPSGFVRNDLDNTMRECNDCHSTGYLGAPVARHAWLPPLHLQRLACQTCHIPHRTVKSLHYAASDVANPGAKIPRLKQIWTFYGPDMRYWNHYGELDMMDYDDKPVDPFYPQYIRYKGKIYPANRVHTSWPALQIEGREGLMQPKMSDYHAMWAAFHNDPASWPELARITDDNGDGIVEINRPEEIDAIITALTRYLHNIAYPMQNTRVVWAMNERIYHSGTEYEVIDKHPWEASPYGNVHKYNHDIFPARSALGANGCTDCHGTQSNFFTRAVTSIPFDEHGRTVTTAQYNIMGLSAARVYTGKVRETWMKPLLYTMMLVLLVSLCMITLRAYLARRMRETMLINSLPILVGTGIVLLYLWITFFTADLGVYMLPGKAFLDGNHFLVGLGIVLATFLLFMIQRNPESKLIRERWLLPWSTTAIAVFRISLLLFVISGIGMLLQLWWVFYTLFDLALLGCLFTASAGVIRSHTTDTAQVHDARAF